MADEKKDEIFYFVRCIGCGYILFEASVETVGVVRKKCRTCKQTRTIKLRLQTGAKRNTITSGVAKAI